MREISTVMLFAIVGVAGWMCFDNVFSSNSAVRELAEHAACGKQNCEQHHTLSHERRLPWDQQFDYAWANATVHVRCRRQYYVMGDRHCAIE